MSFLISSKTAILPLPCVTLAMWTILLAFELILLLQELVKQSWQIMRDINLDNKADVLIH